MSVDFLLLRGRIAAMRLPYFCTERGRHEVAAAHEAIARRKGHEGSNRFRRDQMIVFRDRIQKIVAAGVVVAAAVGATVAIRASTHLQASAHPPVQRP